jgi:uncharacterized repeat protein (TIGR03803 family)
MLSASITTLASFNGFDGSSPAGDLFLSGSTLYGTTRGSANGGPEIFSLPTAGGTPSIVPSSGGVPSPAVLSGGTLFGVDIFGGLSGDGDVLSMPFSGGTPVTLGSFNGTNGAYPTSLIVSGNTIYGTTEADQNIPAEIFSLPTSGGTPTVLASFDATTEGTLLPGLILSGTTLYGTASGGGAGDGEVFSLPTTGGTPTLLGSFGSANEYPSGDLVLSGQTLYGTADEGGLSPGDYDGEVFSLPVSGGTPTLLAPLDNMDGSGLIVSGSTLYGTAQYSGSSSFDGAVFSVPMAGGNATVMALTSDADGSGPNSLILSGSTLYGTTASVDGAPYGGTVFSLPVTATAAGLRVLSDPANLTVDSGAAASFTATAQGSPTPTTQWYVEPAGTSTFTAIAGATSSSYELTSTTGSESGNQYEAVFTNSHGSVTSTPAELSVLSTPSTIASFDGNNGQSPSAIVVSGSSIYGVTSGGGANGDGEVFSVPVAGGTPSMLASFGSTDAGPIDLILSGNTLYGMTLASGSSGTATVFSLPISGGTPTVLASFSVAGEIQPGELVLSGNTLYGAVNNIGSGGFDIFSLPVAGGTPTVLTTTSEEAYISSLTVSGGVIYACEATYGDAGGFLISVPVGGGVTTFLAGLAADGDGQRATSLVVSGNTLYGSTEYSIGEGDEDGGDQEIFSMPTSGGRFAGLYNIGIEGYATDLSLSNGTLYGAMTQAGQDYAFSLPASGGTPALLAQLSSVPSDLILSGGALYGTLPRGGANGDGEVFSVPLETTPVAPASSTISLTSSHVPVYQGQHVTLTATVAAAGGAAGIPTGTVTFYDDGKAISTPLTLTGGTASFTDTTLPIGSDSITATYSGDANFASASTASALIATVRAGPAGTTHSPAPPTIMGATNSASTHGYTIAASVIGTDSGPGGAAGLTYTWTAIQLPAGAKRPTFNVNGTNAASSIIARFSKDGGYILKCEVKNASGEFVTTDVSVTVNQKATSLKIEPHDARIAADGTRQFTGTVLDQFGHPMRTAQNLTYLVTSGHGSISSTGLFGGTPIAGPVTIEVKADDLISTVGLVVG